MTRVFDEDPDVEPEHEPGGHPRPLGVGTVLVTLLIGVLLGWALVSLLELVDQPQPVTPWTMSALLVVLAIAALVAARRMRAALGSRKTRPSSETGVAALSAGRAMLVTGLLLAGGHVAYVVTQMTRLDIDLHRERLVGGSVAIVASALFAWAGSRLERACQIPRDGDADV